MLSLLHIENIAVIELSDITFDGQLNVLTGETGAGKSIVIDALNALLGRRASRELIRSGFDTAEVNGVFFSDFTGEEVVLSRELREDGRNICRADGKPISLSVLREMGDTLVNIHGQHDNQTLLREETHITYLDSFANISTGRYTALYEAWRGLINERERLTAANTDKAARIDMLSYRLQELRNIDPKPGESEILSARRKTLRHAEGIREALNTAYFALYGDEDTRGACELTEEAADAFSGAARHASELEPFAERLRDMQYSLRDCAEEARTLYERMEESEDELEQVEARLDLLSGLRRKHNMDIDELLSAGRQWEAELEGLECSDRRIDELNSAIARAESDVAAEARALSSLRTDAAKRLEAQMTGELRDLDMGKVRFAVECEETPPHALGCDRVWFSIATNVGEPMKPLVKIASGGEMSRIMLALKNLQADSVQTLVFDEVDSGVSGRAAQRVAQKLCSVSRGKQVLCVTHLPQIAAMADSHLHVEKSVEDGRTVTRVVKLDRRGRIEELARIISGASVTDTTRKTAEELLEQADAYKAKLGG